jgi:hypothetical protein
LRERSFGIVCRCCCGGGVGVGCLLLLEDQCVPTFELHVIARHSLGLGAKLDFSDEEDEL